MTEGASKLTSSSGDGINHLIRYHEHPHPPPKHSERVDRVERLTATVHLFINFNIA